MSATETALVVTGSEAAAACGVDPFRSPIALWASKLGLSPERPDTEAMRWGTLLQPIIAAEIEKHEDSAETGYEVMPAPADPIVNARFPWLTGHPDGFVKARYQARESLGVLEIKTTNPYRRGEWADDDTPPHVVVQATVYMLLTDLRWALVACLIGGQSLQLREIEYDDRIAELIVARTREFLGYVERQEPPPPDGAASTSAMIAALHPTATGEVIELTPELFAVAREREALREQAKEIERQQEEKEQVLKLALGDASVGMFGGAKVVTWPSVERAGYSVEAKSYRRFGVRLP